MPLAAAQVNTGDTAWLLAATALVLLMTPGLALFYGGMVRTKSVLNMLMMSFVSIALVTVVWLVAGYSLVFGEDTGAGLIGGLAHAGMAGITPDSVQGTVPTLLFATFQLTFAIITAALISGAIADRAKFGAWLVFVPVWTLLVYVPVAHWVWGPGGWILERLGALDFAGGLPVEITSGASGLALAIVVGPRLGFKKDAMRPHNLPMVVLGAGLLWFGWFGFNAGSALGANGLAAAAFLNTLAAGCTGLLGWLFVEQRRDGHPTTLGAASGAVAGLVAITPSCGSVSLLGALVIGLAAGVVCSYAVGWKFRFDYDDSLDVVGVHLVGGVIGTLLIGVFAASELTGGTTGLLYGGGLTQLGKQALAVVVVAGYAFGVTYGIGKLIDKVMGFRADEDHEHTGLDLTVHAETAYDHGVLGHGAPISHSIQKVTPPA
ncbi:ammonium transporter [Streptomyces acidiscabies]|uniref:Ammonium transporter n=1 Tax=Streptomyces acidiscabies TaxID=42234 RepID=A0AAP6B7E1_9ACTN|nr:ammonium transporter [Streptomyces acidiscabies]MBP5939726.1 ammonium transporter [Streptomyces sp. LBUM 1476]MBZ3910903.1 ammonium transporter [Streptomyces acidiscabies]MDX2959317.1 ammonium transporter [Streptomyces acidiscabies]MDX3017539.1 ammonium transporter [Streptomyces acidiscabies]MDX3788015.1 ammonium transporter [Streptomyces acidiscabies]